MTTVTPIERLHPIATRSSRRHREVERKFECPPAPDLDLSAVQGVREARTAMPVSLRATYYDTEDLRLSARKITMRRREGGEDAGWHLKVPAGDDERTEIRLPLDGAARSVPDELRGLVTALVRGEELVPVVNLRTDRHEHHLVGGHHRELLVVAVDDVRAERLRPGSVELSHWTELEAELVDGRSRDLDHVTAYLRSVGLRRSPWSSKLERALAADAPTRPRERKVSPSSSAGDVVIDYLRRQADEIVAGDVGLRTGQPDSVHRMRVATRRIRSTLATCRPLFEPGDGEHLRSELKWLGQQLGRARDAEVLAVRLLSALAELPGDIVLGPVRDRVAFTLRERGRGALGDLDAELTSARYFELLDHLDAFVAEPPFTHSARRRATRVLPGLVRHTARRVERAASEVERRQDEPGGDARLHEVRKAAKRARYAAELARPTSGHPAKRVAKRMEAVQEVLGEHQDSVAARHELRAIAVEAQLAGESGFTLGLLYGLEAGHARAAQQAYRGVIDRALDRKALHWTS